MKIKVNITFPENKHTSSLVWQLVQGVKLIKSVVELNLDVSITILTFRSLQFSNSSCRGFVLIGRSWVSKDFI